MTSKGTDAVRQQLNTECCMCGDVGFSDQLFQCKVCQFRSQHRYCSNFYPKAESLGTCNWCLSQKEEKSPNSSNSSSSYRNNNSSADDESKIKRTRNGISAQNIGGRRGLRASVLQIQLQKPIKKQKSPDAKSPSPSPSPSQSPSQSPSVVNSTRKRIITNGALEERLRRTKSEDTANNSGATKQVLRSKVRRYKHLDEVSS